jgi:S-adenosylmethionine hydrolase
LKKIVQLEKIAPRRTRRGLVGTITSVDRFGNLITNVDLGAWAALRRPALQAGSFVATSLAPSYGAVRKGELALILGGYGRLEIAARDGSAAAILGLGSGDVVELGERR